MSFCCQRWYKVVESTHNSKIAEVLLTRQHLEKASAKAIDSVMDEIQGTHTPADMWWVEKRISACISHERAKAYKALVEQHRSEPKLPQERMAQVVGPLRMVEAEEEFCKSISDLISTTITEGAKGPGGHGVAINIQYPPAGTKFALELWYSHLALTYHWKKVQDHFGRGTKVLSQQVMAPWVLSPVHL